MAITAGAALRARHLGDVESRSPDETIYLYYSTRIANEGLSVTPKLFAQYEGDSRMWSYPVPNRITHVLLTAAARSGMEDLPVQWMRRHLGR